MKTALLLLAILLSAAPVVAAPVQDQTEKRRIIIDRDAPPGRPFNWNRPALMAYLRLLLR